MKPDIATIWAKAEEYKVQQIKNEFINILNMIPEDAKGIEIGCYSGGGTIAFSMICSKLVSIDIKKIFDTTEVEANCKHKFIEGNSTDPKIIKEVEKFYKKELVDFLFIDGDHSEKGAETDYNNYKHLVKKGGFIFFHDIIDSESHRKQRCFVSRAWNRIRQNHEFKEFIFGDSWGGIGVLIV